MKPLILAAAVAAFELAFFASVASTPTPSPGAVTSAQQTPQGAGTQVLAQRAGEPVPCTPRG